MAEPDHYRALGVKRGATASEIRTAFKTAARRWHPDKNLDDQKEATARFKNITCAYDVLSDEQKRREYDRKESERVKRQTHNDYRGSYQGRGRSWSGKPRGTNWPTSSSGYSRTNSAKRTHTWMSQGPKPKRAERVPNHYPHQNRYPTSTLNGYQHEYVSGIPQSSMHGIYPGPASYYLTTSTTRKVNGRMITTETKLENGVASVRVYVNGILTSETVHVQAFGSFGF